MTGQISLLHPDFIAKQADAPHLLQDGKCPKEESRVGKADALRESWAPAFAQAPLANWLYSQAKTAPPTSPSTAP